MLRALHRCTSVSWAYTHAVIPNMLCCTPDAAQRLRPIDAPRFSGRPASVQTCQARRRAVHHVMREQYSTMHAIVVHVYDCRAARACCHCASAAHLRAVQRPKSPSPCLARVVQVAVRVWCLISTTAPALALISVWTGQCCSVYLARDSFWLEEFAPACVRSRVAQLASHHHVALVSLVTL